MCNNLKITFWPNACDGMMLVSRMFCVCRLRGFHALIGKSCEQLHHTDSHTNTHMQAHTNTEPNERGGAWKGDEMVCGIHRDLCYF